MTNELDPQVKALLMQFRAYAAQRSAPDRVHTTPSSAFRRRISVFFRFDGCSAIKSGLRPAILVCALATATAGVADAAAGNVNPQTGMRAIESAYHQLVHELDLSRGARPDGAIRRRITVAAQGFQNTIKRDGGARPDLDADARNIIVSLTDGTFSAEKSLDVLRRDARGSVIDAGAWSPSSLGGAPIPGAIGTHLNQTNEGDCVGISVIKAFSNTQVGSGILRKAVTGNADGSYNVSLPGDPSTVYHLSSSELDQFGKGDPAAAAVVGAMFRYFHLDPAKTALPTNKVMELLAGHSGDHARLADSETAPQGIVDFLVRNADGVGNHVAMVFGGKPGHKGEWSKGDGHAFALIHIDAASGMLTYTNPWNEGEETRTIAMADLARQAAGTRADFETITFR
jgi:hypothetical protein